MDVILKFPDGHKRTLVYGMTPGDLLRSSLDSLVDKLSVWGVYYGKRRFQPTSGAFVTTTHETNFEITLEEVND